MDPRLDDINKVFTAFSRGIFTKRLNVPEVNDELSSCMWMFNIVGEELQQIAIHRDFFMEIFNTVNNMIFVISTKGIIEDVNKAVLLCLKFEKKELLGLPFGGIFKDFKHTQWKLFNHTPNGIRSPSYQFIDAHNENIPVSITLTSLNDPNRGKKIIVVAKDLSVEMALEKDNIRRQIFGQEHERLKLSRDLHDGVGQKLTAIRFLLLSIAAENNLPIISDRLSIAEQTLFDVIGEIRTLSFSLMPAALEDHGLYVALNELCTNFWSASKLKIKFDYDGLSIPSDSVSIDLYRIVQEFLSNTLKHAQATRVWIELKSVDGKVVMKLKDNGIGFDLSVAKMGMGLHNIQSRIKAHDGSLSIFSRPGKGTRIQITMPI